MKKRKKEEPNPLSGNPRKWSNTLKQFSAKADELLVFDHFLGLAFKGLKEELLKLLLVFFSRSNTNIST